MLVLSLLPETSSRNLLCALDPVPILQVFRLVIQSKIRFSVRVNSYILFEKNIIYICCLIFQKLKANPL